MIIWAGWGILAVLFPALGATFMASLAGMNSAGTGASMAMIGFGLTAGAVGGFFSTRWMNEGSLTQQFGVQSLTHLLGSIISVIIGIRLNRVVSGREASLALESLRIHRERSVAEGHLTQPATRHQFEDEQAIVRSRLRHQNRPCGCRWTTPTPCSPSWPGSAPCWE